MSCGVLMGGCGTLALWLISLGEVLVVLCAFLVLLVEVWASAVDFSCTELVVQYYLGFSLDVYDLLF